ncbi:MAG TPA: hypothetical protein VNA69_22050 [Thermoanaerobaculia bacterium]|nr:hypothetical protein [Thermoanaerobaculia bacterium]
MKLVVSPNDEIRAAYCSLRRDEVTSFLLPLLILVAWFVLMRFVLPRFGVPT